MRRRRRQVGPSGAVNVATELGFCPICWAAMWRVHRDVHLEWHDRQGDSPTSATPTQLDSAKRVNCPHPDAYIDMAGRPVCDTCRARLGRHTRIGSEETP